MARPGEPTPRERLAYTFGGRLPGSTAWVRHDLTDHGWRLRVLGRVAAQLVPLLVAAAVLGALTLDAVSAVLLVLLLALASLGTMAMVADQLRDRRLRQHGLPVPVDPDEEFRNRRRY